MLPKILVVDDSESARSSMRRILEQNAGTFPPDALEAVFRELLEALHGDHDAADFGPRLRGRRLGGGRGE